MKYEAKSIVFGRRPRRNPEEFKTAFFMIYNCEKPLGSDEFPLHDLEFPDTEYVELPNNSHIRYYLEGNDIVIEGITSVELIQNANSISVKVE